MTAKVHILWSKNKAKIPHYLVKGGIVVIKNSNTKENIQIHLNKTAEIKPSQLNIFF